MKFAPQWFASGQNSQTHSKMASSNQQEDGSPSVADLAEARSVTLIIHGVGAHTGTKLLDEAGKGCAASGLGQPSKPWTMPECPSLGGRQDANSYIILRGESGCHFVIALPWSNIRLRTEHIAKWCAMGLGLALALLAAAFATGTQLAAFAGWLDEGSNESDLIKFLLSSYLVPVAYLFAMVLARREISLGGLLTANYALVIGVCAGPSLVLALLFAFAYAPVTWLLTPIFLLVTALFVASTIIVVRCLPFVPTARWRLSFAALAFALAFLSGGVVRVAIQLSTRIEKIASQAGSESLSLSHARAAEPQSRQAGPGAFGRSSAEASTGKANGPSDDNRISASRLQSSELPNDVPDLENKTDMLNDSPGPLPAKVSSKAFLAMNRWNDFVDSETSAHAAGSLVVGMHPVNPSGG